MVTAVCEIGTTLVIVGELDTAEDVTISGRVDGSVVALSSLVSITASGCLDGTLTARDVTIVGRASGTILATGRVDIRAGARVTARLLTPKLVLDDGAWFKGTVEPHRVDAALRVHEHRAAADRGERP
jgi:cytoskeletal protein CcmA (bactofilin family)